MTASMPHAIQNVMRDPSLAATWASANAPDSARSPSVIVSRRMPFPF